MIKNECIQENNPADDLVDEKKYEECHKRHKANANHGVSQQLEVTQSSFLASASGSKRDNMAVLQLNAILKPVQHLGKTTVFSELIFLTCPTGFKRKLAAAEAGFDLYLHTVCLFVEVRDSVL